jgi:putative hydrolase of the HAD superfamily
MSQKPITAFFLDIGGVLLTNGWSRDLRQHAADRFGLDYEDMDERHHMTFGTYEEGKLSLDQYLDRVIFFKDRPFTREDFKAFMFAQSEPLPEMIEFVCRLKQAYQLKIAAVSNEGRELTIYRVKKFNLTRFIDFFIASCFVHFRKPDEDIYRIALDCAQVPAEEVVYIDDRAMFVEIAQGLGIRGIVHTGFESTRKKLKEMGLEIHS